MSLKPTRVANANGTRSLPGMISESGNSCSHYSCRCCCCWCCCRWCCCRCCCIKPIALCITLQGVTVAVAVGFRFRYRFRFRFKPIQTIGDRATFVVVAAFDSFSLHFRELDEWNEVTQCSINLTLWNEFIPFI